LSREGREALGNADRLDPVTAKAPPFGLRRKYSARQSVSKAAFVQFMRYIEKSFAPFARVLAS